MTGCSGPRMRGAGGRVLPEALATEASAVTAAKAYLRIEDGASDALLEGLAASAVALCEAFTRSVLIAREVNEYLPASSAWQRLARTPVRGIDRVAAVTVDGAEAELPVAAFAIDIGADGDGCRPA
ncbi:head-tail connector protein [Sphingomonas montanisoli]|uniref:Phage gp6-like head-tail connector protein n=1 Tax=Sphingomonas montanisoli TaxID=2606412 RepID=A0A5D9CBE6_9SPHN|nr:head-tail connector protein [Sphingomonas montanisoli]TZG29278.1 phage gp6-like head-tail connector protein [Sphingomonas montanisoli]